MVNLLYWQTFCQHHLRSAGPIDCIHGTLTSTGGNLLGTAHTGFLIYDVEGW